MEQSPDVIVITVNHEEEIIADRADLLVTVRGSSLVTGRTALRKAKEVSELVADLEKCGVTQDDISLEGIHAEVSSGVLGKSSSATYQLRIRCNSFERLPEALGAITSAKNATLESVDWRYPDSPEQQVRWLQKCIGVANMKAEAAATALGVRLIGVHRLSETLAEEDRRPSHRSDFLTKRRQSVPIQTGFDLSHQKRCGVQVTVEYRVESSDLYAAVRN